jgi:hypothetical protein
MEDRDLRGFGEYWAWSDCFGLNEAVDTNTFGADANDDEEDHVALNFSSAKS